MMKIFVIITMVVSLSNGTLLQEPRDKEPTDPGLKQVLLLGDSVMAGIGRSDQGMKYLETNFRVIFKAIGCQRLEAIGCTKSSVQSAFEILKSNAGLFTKAVVVSTGYNEFDNSKAFRKTVLDFCGEASRQGVQIVWLTYREAGNVKKKAEGFNKILNAQVDTCKNLKILDWNALSKGKKGWFAGDEVHLQGVGPLKMAQFIADFVDSI